MNGGGGWRRECDSAAGGSPGLLVNELVGCSLRLGTDSHCPRLARSVSPSYTHSYIHTCMHTQIICVGFVKIVSFPTSLNVARTQTPHKNNMSEFDHELLKATGLLQVLLTAVMMRGKTP